MKPPLLKENGTIGKTTTTVVVESCKNCNNSIEAAATENHPLNFSSLQFEARSPSKQPRLLSPTNSNDNKKCMNRNGTSSHSSSSSTASTASTNGSSSKVWIPAKTEWMKITIHNGHLDRQFVFSKVFCHFSTFCEWIYNKKPSLRETNDCRKEAFFSLFFTKKNPFEANCVPPDHCTYY